MNNGSILKNRRLELGLTLKEVCKKVGVSEGTVSRWESGDIANMKRDKIAKLATVLQLDPTLIMGLNTQTVEIEAENGDIKSLIVSADDYVLLSKLKALPITDKKYIFRLIDALSEKKER